MLKSMFMRVKLWCIPIGLTLFFYVLLNYVLMVGYIPSESMEPTLPKGSFIIGIRFFDEPQIGDIIIFKKEGILQIKRVAAVPGDVVDWSQLTYMDSVPIPERNKDVITIPKDCYFVLGDNTQTSWDSRYWNTPFVGRDQIVAIVK